MPAPSSKPDSESVPAPATWGSNEGWTIDYNRRRDRCAGHGLFHGLEDQKRYKVEGGFAHRGEEQKGLLGMFTRLLVLLLPFSL